MPQADELADAARGTGLGTGELPQRGAEGQQRLPVRLAHQVPDAVAQQRVARESAQRGDVGQHVLHSPAERRAGAHCHALVRESRTGERPAASDLADDAVVRDEDVIEEDLVEGSVTGELAQRPDVDARCRHVEQEVRDALVAVRPLAGAAGAHQQDRPVGDLRHRGPDLLAGDLPAALDLLGAGLQRGEVGARAGLAEHLAPDDLACCVGRTKRSCWSGVPCATIVGAAQPPMMRSGRFTQGLGKVDLSVMRAAGRPDVDAD